MSSCAGFPKLANTLITSFTSCRLSLDGQQKN